MPSHDLLFWPIGIGDDFVMDAVLSVRVSAGSLHDFTPRIRRTEVRPIRTRRAISDLLTPARWSFRISAAWTAAVAFRSAVHPLIQPAFVPAESPARTRRRWRAARPWRDRLGVVRLRLG